MGYTLCNSLSLSLHLKGLACIGGYPKGHDTQHLLRSECASEKVPLLYKDLDTRTTLEPHVCFQEGALCVERLMAHPPLAPILK